MSLLAQHFGHPLQNGFACEINLRLPSLSAGRSELIDFIADKNALDVDPSFFRNRGRTTATAFLGSIFAHERQYTPKRITAS